MSHMPAVVWNEAEGFLIRDDFGNQWIDLTSGIVMANVGHSHPSVIKAIHEAADAKLLASYLFAQTQRLALEEKLLALSPIPDAKVAVFSTGTEATECAMMLMRRHGQRLDPRKVGILSFVDGYHGRTLAATLAAGHSNGSDWITRERVSHYQIPFPFAPKWPRSGDKHDDASDVRAFAQCIAQLAEHGIRPEHIAGFIGEAVPGWATWPMPVGFARALVDWMHEYDILVCFDEVQSGCGRTGKMFGFEHCGVVPDLLTLGKGLSSSLPVSAVVGRREIMDGPAPGEMSSTHGGNPVCAAAALASLSILEDERMFDSAVRTGALMLKRLQVLADRNPDRILSIHGPGLFISIHVRNPVTGEPDVEFADAIVLEAVRRGVMMFPTSRGFLKLTPPLNIDPAAALEACDVLIECFDALEMKYRRSGIPVLLRGPHAPVLATDGKARDGSNA